MFLYQPLYPNQLVRSLYYSPDIVLPSKQRPMIFPKSFLFILSVSCYSRHSFKENTGDRSRIDLDNNPLFGEVDAIVVKEVIDFIYTGGLMSCS